MKKRMMKEWMTDAWERFVRQGETGRTYMGRMGRSAKRAALVAAALLSCAGMSAGRVRAEGSRDIIRTSIENAKAINPSKSEAELKKDIARWSFSAIPNQSFMGVDKQQKIKFYAYAGEVVFFGSNAVKDTTRDVIVTCPNGSQELLNLEDGPNGGYIEDPDQEEAGPKGIYLPEEKKIGETQTYKKVGNEKGFEPYKYPVLQSGVYEVQFKADNQEDHRTSEGKDDNVDKSKSDITKINDAKNHVTAWDITVTQPKTVEGTTEYYAVNGRVWMDAIMIQTGTGVYGNLFAVTRDGYIWKFSLNGMKPYTFSMYANARGGIGTGTNASVYHSVHDYKSNNTSFKVYNDLTDKNGNPDGLLIYGPDNEKTDIDAPCHMFVNMPDITMPDDIILSEAKEVGDIKSIRYDGRSGEKDTAVGVQQGYVGVGGYFEVETKDATSYRIIIDMSNMYAKDYHGNGTVECDGSSAHNEEICLSTPEDPSFVYKKGDSWYSIQTKVQKGEAYDRHPVNEEGEESDPETDFSNLIEEVLIDDRDVPAELKGVELGEDTAKYKCLGKIMLGNAAVNGEKDRIKWNGRDQYGRILPLGAYFGDTEKGKVYAQAKGGEIHFPLGDVEGMTNGVAVWLENPPQSTKDKSPGEQYIDRASVYYNNSEKSLLRDYYTGASINNALIWNLPKEDCFEGEAWANIYGGLTASIDDIYKYNLHYENMSIVGALSHNYTGAEDVLTKQACSLTDASDHGVVDIWTHVVENGRTPLNDPIYLYHYGTKKIITGFAYLDTPKVNNGDGQYDKMTDDRELPEAIITAEYGDVENRITYTTSTDTDGYYSIPIDTKSFDSAGSKDVTITVRYEDPNVTLEDAGEGVKVKKISTFKVSTASNESKQKIIKAPNISVQTIALATKSGESYTDVTTKEVRAEDVGYTYLKSNPIRIEKQWVPAYLKDNSMRAVFQIKGIRASERTASTDIEKDTAFDDPTKIVYDTKNIPVDESLGGIGIVDYLPGCAYVMPKEYTEGTKLTTSEINDNEKIAYRVEESLSGSKVSSSLGDHSVLEQENPSGTGTAITYDNWVYVNKIVPSTFKETVWYDVNNNGICDEGETKIQGAKVTFAKLDEMTSAEGTDVDADSRYKIDFQYASPGSMSSEAGGVAGGSSGEEGLLSNEELIGDEDAIVTDKNGEYPFPGGLIAGRYRVTIELPEGTTYNTATYTGDGDSALAIAGSTEESIIKAITREKTKVVQYINIAAGYEYEARTGYGYAGGLSIRKNVDVASAGDNSEIIEEIEKEEFTFEIQLADKPWGVGVVDITDENQKEEATKLGIEDTDSEKKLPIGSCVVDVETFDLDIDSGAEVPADKDKRIVFIENKDDYGAEPRWCSVFTLKSGERITIPNIDGNTEYWLWEYDNQNDGSDDSEKNGSDTLTGTDVAPLTYMPKGYSLAKLVGSSKMRHGNVPSTSRTVLVNYTNVYEPMPVKGFGGDGTDAKKTTVESKKFTMEGREEIDKALDIRATVNIVDDDTGDDKRTFRNSDTFKLLLEPLDSTYPVFETPGLDVKATETEVSAKKASVEANFTDNTIVRFTKAGTYEYRLREARPFYDDGVEAIAGISYATEEYKLVITVEDVYQQLQIKETKWYEKNKAGGWETTSLDAPESLIFNNYFSTDRMSTTIAGNKVLESSVDGVTLANVGPFEFKLTPGGGKNRAEESDDFNMTDGVLAKQPMPAEGTQGEGKSRSKTVENTSSTVADNVSFGEITFTAENAGEDLQHAMIYRYYVEEVKPTTDEKNGITYDEAKPEEKPVYVRAYKEVKEDENNNQMQTVVVEMCDERGYAAAAGEDFTFTNEYHAEATVPLGNGGLGLSLKKTINTINADGVSVTSDAQRGFKDEDRFVFTVEPQGDAPAVTDTDPSTSVDGDINWTYSASAGKGEAKTSQEIAVTGKTITFTNTGTYFYTLRELDPFRAEREKYTINDSLTGISYDPTVYTIEVEVTNKVESGTGTTEQYAGELEAKITKITKAGETESVYSSSTGSTELEFTNTYSPYIDEETIVGRKLLESNDPSVNLERILDSGAKFEFRLTPAGKADYTGETSATALTYKEDDIATQPMPSEASDSDGGVSVTVTKDGRISFPPIPFALEDVEGKTAEDAVVYRYKVEETKPSMSGITTKPEPQYVYFKVYVQRQDEVDHVVAVRCDSAGQTVAQSTYDFVITNTYTVPKREINLGEYVDAAKILQKGKDQTIPEGTSFAFVLEAQNGAPEPYGDEETKPAVADIDMKDADSQPDGSLRKDLGLKNLHLSFSQEGDGYQYVLRELNPFNGEDAPAVPGVTYNAVRYRLSFKTVNNFTENKLDVILTEIESSENNGSSWESIWAGTATGTEAGSGTPTKPESLIFKNIYGGSNAVVPISGSKVLEGAQNLEQGDFAFYLQAAGMKEYDETTKGYGALKKDEETLKSMPLPASIDGVELDSVPSTGGSTATGLQRAVTQNGANTFIDEKVWLSRGVVNFGNLVFDEKHAGEDVEHAKIYAYTITEQQPSGENVIETAGKKTKKFDNHDITYANDTVTLYIRVYKIEVNQVEMIAAEFCDENGSTEGTVNRSFTFTNIYTPHPLEVSPDELLRKALSLEDDSAVAKKTLKVEAGTFKATDAGSNSFLFAFYPASYPIADAPMPKDGAGEEISRAIVPVKTSEFSNASKEATKSEVFSIDGNKIAFSSEGTYSYRIRELNPAVDTLDDSEKSAGDLTAIENMEYDSVFYMLTVTVTYNNEAGKYEYTAELSKTDSLTGESKSISLSKEPLSFENIYTERHKLIYDGNAVARTDDGKTDNVYNVPESQTYECGAEITLVEQEPVYAEADGQKVVFIGWSKNQIRKILSATDMVDLPAEENRYKATQPYNLVMDNADIWLYAVWGYDENNNGVADVLETKLTLTYDPNAQSGGTVEPADGYKNLIDPVPNLLPGDRVPLADCRPVVTPVPGGEPSVTYKLKHSAVDGVAVVFAGWTEEAVEKILDYEAHDTVKLLQDTITMPRGDKTVYAAWGYDRNGDGVADVLEETYNLNYVANPQEDGEVKPETMPNGYRMAGHLTDTTVDLETYSDPEKAPKHSSVTGKAVAFIGWTLEQTTELYTKDSPAAPVTVEHVTFGHDDIYVYASWGYDENNNGVADVLEKQYTLTYHGNAQENGTVLRMPVPERVTGNLAGNLLDLAGKLPGTEGIAKQKPTLTGISDGADVLFLGWTETQSGRIYDVSDPLEPTLGAGELEDQLLKPGAGAQVEFVSSEGEIEEEKKENSELCAVWTEDANLYAAWAKDANKDGVADYKQGLLVYNGNPVQGMAWQVPESEIHSLRDSAGRTVTVALADGVSVPDEDDPILLPVHSDVEDRKVAFVGWTDDAKWYANAEKNKIYSRTERNELPTRITETEMQKLVTVYAVWGYDENGNGVADVLEDLYTLRYKGNPQEVTESGVQKDGTVEKLPDAVQDLLADETVQLADGETVKDAAGEVIPLPVHSPTELADASGKTEEVPVRFVGWTSTPVDGILEGKDEIPTDVYTQVAVGIAPFEGTIEGDRKIITLYAAWGYDTNKNGRPDVLEECELVYDENKIDEGTVDSIPDPKEHLIFGQTVELAGLADDAPTHSEAKNPDPATSTEHLTVGVVFVGWTEQENADFYEAGDEMPHCLTEVTIEQKLTTVYAAWGYDVDGNGIPDVKESCRLVFNGNPQLEGSVVGYPVEKEGLTYAESVKLDSILTELGKTAPTHTDVMVGGAPTKVAFVGWTLEPVEELLTRSSAAPDCVSEVEMLHSVVTVYAAWGLDTNGNGVADVVEERYRLSYDGNTDGAGTVDNLPLTVTGLLQDDQLTLIESPTPLYPEPDKEKILFIGWTKEKTGILGKDNTAPEFVKQVIVGSEDFPGTEIDGKKTVTVYAAWSMDENEDGIPDVWQNGRLVYDGNVPEGGSLAEGTLPEDITEYTYNPATPVKLDVTKTPKLTGKVTVSGVETAAAFIGWTKEPQSTVYTLQNTRGEIEELKKLLLDEVSVDAKTVTVYAVWGADTNDNGTADVLEPLYSLTYDPWPVTGSASGAPIDENRYLVGTTVTLDQETKPLHSAVTENGSLADVLFLGWTSADATTGKGPAKYYRKSDADSLPAFLDEVAIEEGGTTVYAVWGLDTNRNGTADVRETTYTLRYHDNAVDGTVEASCVPADEAPFISGDVAQLKPMRNPQTAHSKVKADGAMRDVVFLGWTLEPTDEIYTKESPELPDLAEKLTFADADMDVYAAWALDTNGNGTADILERYTLIYDPNPQEGGFVGDMPQNVPNRVSGDRVTLGGKPQHSPAEVNGVQVPVVFAGWTSGRTEGIYGRTDEPPKDIQTEVAFADADITVYAAWGYDTNGDGTADVLEKEYSLTFLGNPIDGTTVRQLPQRMTGLLGRERVLLPVQKPQHDPVTYQGIRNVSVLFVGWTETRNQRIYARDELGYVEYLKESVIMPYDDKELYAAWGYDLDGNGMADVLEDHYDLIYNGNAQNSGGVSNLPADRSVAGNLSGARVVLDTATVPVHRTPQGGTPLVFIGWTMEAQKPCGKGDELPPLVSEVTFEDGDITVYAAWGYDTNGNGTADILESYTLTYDANVQLDGFADHVPEAAEDLIWKQEVQLADGPRHSAVKLDGSDRNVDVAFIGWTEKPEDLLAKDSELPDHFEEGGRFAMEDGDTVLYALWGIDANGNGTADVLEPKYTLIYDGNPTDGTKVTEVPEAMDGLILGERVELVNGSTKDAGGNVIPVPKHEPAVYKAGGQEVPVLFIGWSAAPTDVIYARGEGRKVSLLPEIYTIGGDTLVYAVWGYDTDENGIADILEDTYQLIYEDNPQESGFTGFMPENVAGFAEGEQWKLSNSPLPQHSAVKESGERRDVAFIGWTLEQDPKLCGREGTVPALVEEVTFAHEDIRVYAVWGVDENGNGIADILEEKYSLFYDGNPVIGEAFDVPADENKYLVDERIDLSRNQPTHSDVENRTVVFLGWTRTPSTMIYEGAGTPAAAAADGTTAALPELIDSVEMEEGGVTVYAAWGYATNLVHVPVNLAGTKMVTAEEEPFAMQGGEFEFAVIPAEGNLPNDPVDETRVSNRADGSIPLISNAVYTETGTYQYTIEELGDSEIPGMRYDDSAYELTVTVTGSGREAQADIAITKNGRTAERILFENTYAPEIARISIEGRKTLDGRNLESGEFAFTLEPVSAEVEEEAEEVQNPLSAVVSAEEDAETELAAEPETESESVNEAESESERESESEPVGETQPETSAQSETQPETSAQSETQPQTEAPAQSETQVQTEAPAQSEETQAQTELVLACSYVPHTHTDECLNEAGILVCGYADYVVHTHNEDCYDAYGNLVCLLPELEEHKHDESCYEQKEELVCGLLEGNGHTHSDSCYAVDTTLICGLEETPGHTHSDSCYTVDTTLICGLEESAGHYHDEYCYDTDGNLICGWEESAGHYHTDSCYRRDYRLVCGQEERPAHYHTDSCYEKNTYLTCGMAEAPAHIHDESCYLSVQQCDKPEIELHRHRKKCYKRVYDEEKDEWQKVLVCGKLEVREHVHGPECFKTVELSPAAVQAEDIVQDGSGQSTAEFSEDGPVPVQDDSTAVVAGGLQVLSVEVVPMETSSQPMSQAATEAIPESETATEALTEAVSESETATKTPTEPMSESEMATEALTEAVSESKTATETLTEAVSESETATEVPTEAVSESETAAAAEEQAEPQMLALDETMQQASELTVTRALKVEDIPMPASPEAQNTAAGVFRFGAIEYTKPGVYTYRISEKNTKEEGIAFDEAVYYAVVTVTKNDSGALQSEAELRTESGNTVSEIVFANKYLSPVPEISISQSVNDGPILEETQNVYEGDVITYYLTVTNSAPAGSASAKDVTVVDSIPSGLELVAGSISDGGTLENRVITWMLGDIPAGESRTVSFRVTAPQVQTNIVRTNMGNVRAANSPYGANVWSGSNVVRINVLALRPKASDTPGTEEPQQTEHKDQGSGTESEPKNESKNTTTDKTETETETDDAEVVAPSASDGRISGGSSGSSSSGGSSAGTAASSAAKTGDETNVICWLTLMLMSGAVLILLLARSRNHCNESEKE